MDRHMYICMYIGVMLRNVINMLPLLMSRLQMYIYVQERKTFF